MNMLVKNLLVYTLMSVIVVVFFREFIIVLNYLMINKTIPFYRVNIQFSNVGFILYIKDIVLLLWNIIWVSVFIKKKYTVFFIMGFLLFVLLNMIVAGGHLIWLGVASDIRILMSVYAVLGIYMTVKYYPTSMLQKIIFLFVFLVVFDAVISLVEFYFIGFKFGCRIMGLFSNAATNAYVLICGELLLLLIFKYYKIGTIKLMTLITIVFFALLTTGTRIAIIAFLIVLFIFIFIELLEKNTLNKYLKLSIILIMPIFIFVLLGSAILFSNKIADRGNILDQDNGGRISKLFSIIDTLDAHGRLFFGEGSGYGSNMLTGLSNNMPNVYKAVDGTIQFLLIHSGIIGSLLIYIVFFYAVYKMQKYNKKLNFLLLTPIIFIGMSVDVLEQTPVLLAFGLAISYAYQQEYLKRKTYI
jgi:hypothetical protein